MKYTDKQVILLNLILKGNDDGTFLDIDQLLEALPYETTKASLHFSLRALIKHGMIEKREREKRRCRMRRVIAPTGNAYLAFGRAHPTPELMREEPRVAEFLNF